MKKIVATEKAPGAIGPYSQAVVSGGFLFGSGQIPIDPESGQLITGDIKEQTRRVLENISAVLASEGLTPENIVRTECFLCDMNEFPDFNAVYSDFFKVDPPARSTVEVSRLPKDVRVEIAFTAEVISKTSFF